MLRMELADQPFNKAERNRQLQEALADRSHGSVEYKHQNISAVLIEMGYPYVQGYKPMGNYQDLLRDVVAEKLAGDPSLPALVKGAVDLGVETPPSVDDLMAILVDPPKREEKPSRVKDKPHQSPRVPTTTNFLERESRNRSLGRAGEELVLRYEHERLWRAGQSKLAERIEHVSITRGDGLGYDIESFEESGKPRLIEVKTTRFGSMTPFFASKNEVTVSAKREGEYCLYRVYDFRDRPRLFVLPGALRSNFDLEPIELRACIR